MSIGLKRLRPSRRGMPARRWTAEEDAVIRATLLKQSAEEVAARLGRSPYAVGDRARRIGVYRKEHRSWTEAEVDFLVKNFTSMRYVDLAKALKRSYRSVEGMLYVTLRIKKRRHHKWTDRDTRKLRKMYPGTSLEKIAAAIGASRATVSTKLRQFGLK